MLTIEDIDRQLHSELAVALYFSAPTCNVCHALKPKLLSAFEENFAQLQVISVDISETRNQGPESAWSDAAEFHQCPDFSGGGMFIQIGHGQKLPQF